MSYRSLVARSGQVTESNDTSGPTSYPTGGFSVRTNIGRVDEALVEGDSGTNVYEKTSVGDNNAIVIQAFSQASGGEIAAGTDLSGDTITYTAYML